MGSEFEKLAEIDKNDGKLGFTGEDDKLMHSVLEHDGEAIKDGKILNEALNQGMGNFTPDIMFENIVNDYKVAEQIYGPTMIRELTGYDPEYIGKNSKIPEFQRELKKSIAENIDGLKEKGLLDGDNTISDKGVEMAALSLYMEELDRIVPKGLEGENIEKKKEHHGDKQNIKSYSKSDSYRSISIRNSIKTAIRRNHQHLQMNDLKSFEKKNKGNHCIIYAIDSSGSMKGKKLMGAKRAGISLAFKAIEKKDQVGLVVFGKEVVGHVPPTRDFATLVREITKIRSSQQTDIVKSIDKAIELFPVKNITKHLILLTDALPTAGEQPVKDTLKAVSLARDKHITTSIIGIGLDEEGENIAKQIAEIGLGRMYVVNNVEDLDGIMLEEYGRI